MFGLRDTSVEDVCRETGMTKSSFFYYFKSKEELVIAGAAHFGKMAAALLANVPYRRHADLVDRLTGYVDFRIEILRDNLSDSTCDFGTLIRET